MRGPAMLLAMVLAAPIGRGAGEAEIEARRKAALDQLLRILPKSEAFERWLAATGELPPDFDALPRLPGLPDPLAAADGAKVTSPEGWAGRRAELLDLFRRYVIGTYPPPPGNIEATILTEREEAGARVREIRLAFGPARRATLRLELLIPDGEGPFPVFLTQHNHRGWALVALARGYVGCVYAGADSRDDTGAYTGIWPEYDWTKLTRRAWAAGRCIDYLATLPFVDARRIGITGHSRNGKQSLIAAAIDERIAAVISSSSGAGGACTYRDFGEDEFGEGIELITRVFPDWLHPRLRFFAGREDRLPIDQHELVALAAPRACLIATALNDNVESVRAIQRAYLAAKPVWQLLGAEDRLRIAWRHGTHETLAEDIEIYVDWFDSAFGRGGSDFPEVLLWPRREDPPGLGEAPPSAANPGGTYGAERVWRATQLGRGSVPSGLKKASINFGDYIAGDIYYPEKAEGGAARIPACIWLHPISCSNGYVAGYRRGEPVHIALARRGFAVFAYDQIGYGSRIEEVTRFHDRYPRWTLLGKMVRDARAAVDALERIPFVDAERIFALGFAAGGEVALRTAAVEPRIAGAAVVSGREGFGAETIREAAGAIAPRPLILVTPTLDRAGGLAEIETLLAGAEDAYARRGAGGRFIHIAPEDYVRFGPEVQRPAFDALASNALARMPGR
ncbi:MAG: acetylxylan esterase [Planctomycetes bacterium]|nr:acetylxylan esterase [Planctomycetota bacterium]